MHATHISLPSGAIAHTVVVAATMLISQATCVASKLADSLTLLSIVNRGSLSTWGTYQIVWNCCEASLTEIKRPGTFLLIIRSQVAYRRLSNDDFIAKGSDVLKSNEHCCVVVATLCPVWGQEITLQARAFGFLKSASSIVKFSLFHVLACSATCLERRRRQTSICSCACLTAKIRLQGVTYMFFAARVRSHNHVMWHHAAGRGVFHKINWCGSDMT